VPVTRLTDLVTQTLQHLKRPPASTEPDWQTSAVELSALLLQPVAKWLAPAQPLCIVPDKALNFLPYGVLPLPGSQQLLIETQQLLYAPSASLFVLASEAAQRKGQVAQERLLSIGNPRFDRRAFPDLPDLPAAAREAETVAGYYDRRRLLLGEQARKEAVLRELPQAEVIHLALHHVADPASPLLSKLLLTAEPARAGQPAVAADGLTTQEIYQQNLERARLVVLSACQTRADSYFHGEGPMGITRAFEAAGVPLVVASLWPVDSPATAQLMTNFHWLRRQQGLSTAAALRAAQLHLLRDANGLYRHPYYWASFVVVGGASSF
jgi:CHAT domain-containing protein